MRIILKTQLIYLLIVIVCITQTTQGWCAQSQRNTIATHVDEQQVTKAFRPGKFLSATPQQIRDRVVKPLQNTIATSAKKARPHIRTLRDHVAISWKVSKNYLERYLSQRKKLTRYKRVLLDLFIVAWFIKPLFAFLIILFARGPTTAYDHIADSTNVYKEYLSQLTTRRDATRFSRPYPIELLLGDLSNIPDYWSIPDSLHRHFWNAAVGKDSVELIVDPDSSFMPTRITVTNAHDYEVLHSIANGTIATSDHWKQIAQHSIREIDRHGGWRALERKIIDEQLPLIPKTKVPYRFRIGGKSYWRTYLKPDMDSLQELANTLPPLPNKVVPIMPEDAAINEMQKIIKYAAENNLPIYEKDLAVPMTHVIAHYLMRAAPDLEVFILPTDYLSGMYPEPTSDFFTIQWLNAQRHPRVNTTTGLMEIHLETDLTKKTLGFGNCAYPKLLPKIISNNGKGMAQYSHFLEYHNTELLETIPQSELIMGSRDLFRIYIAIKIDEIVTDLLKRQPHIKKLGLWESHPNGTYQSRYAKKPSPSSGWSATYDPKEITFHRNDTIITHKDRMERNKAKGYDYGEGIDRKWLLEKSRIPGITQGINSRAISQLRKLGVLTWPDDSYPYVYFTDMILRNGGKYILFDKMRQMGWEETDSNWRTLSMALDKHGLYKITLKQIIDHDLYNAVNNTGWPVAPLEESIRRNLDILFEQVEWLIEPFEPSTTTDSTASLTEEIYAAA